MSLLNKLLKKSSSKIVETPKKAEPAKKSPEFKPDGILIAPHTAEKALAAQKNNQYIFKISSRANKIMVADAIKKIYKVKVMAVNIINIPKKEIRVGRTQGFKAGYKKAIITLAKGQSIEVK